MKIIRGKDYYDYALAYGVDPEIVLARDNIDISKDDKFLRNNIHSSYRDFEVLDKDEKYLPWVHNRLKFAHGKYLNIVSRTVIVAGVQHFGYRLDTESEYEIESSVYAWSEEELKKLVESFGFGFRRRKRMFTNEYFNGIFEWKCNDTLLDYLKKNRYHIVTLNNNYDDWRANGDNLKDFQFFKKMDPFQITQELSMWIANLPKDPLPKPLDITDNNVKIAKHGFDKFSFRKAKSK